MVRLEPALREATMADEKSGDGARKVRSPWENLSPPQFRATEPLRLPEEVEPPWELDKESRAAEVKEPARGWSWRRILGTGFLGAAAFGGGFAAGGGSPTAIVQIMPTPAESAVNAIAHGLASASKLASPEVMEKAEAAFRSALAATWSECESLIKGIGEDQIKDLVKTGVSALVLKYVLDPFLARLKAAPFNPIVFDATRLLEKIAGRLRDDPKAKLDERNVASWTEVTPDQAQLLLRALKLHEVDGHWLLETNRPALDLALSVAARG
jgi:hypothetical protein